MTLNRASVDLQPNFTFFSVPPLRPGNAQMCSMGKLCFKSPSNSDLDKQREQNNIIEKELNKLNKEYKKTHRLLLLGAGESGKSTIVKQMRILHEQGGFSDKEKLQKILDIKRNLRDGMISILTGMKCLNIVATTNKTT